VREGNVESGTEATTTVAATDAAAATERGRNETRRQ